MAGIAGVPVAVATSTEALGLGELVLQGSSPEGRQNALTVKLKSLSPGGMGGLAPPNLVAVPLALAQRLFGMDGRVTELAVALAPGADRDAVMARIEAALGKDFEVRTWESLMPFVPGLAAQHRLLIALVTGILGTFVAFSVANTMQMCVQERVGEIGTMMAVGADGRYIQRIFLGEALAIGLAGGVSGILLGSGVTLFLAWVGIPLGEAVPMFQGGLKPVLEPFVPTLVFVGVVLLATGSGVLPAARAAKLGPADALRRV
jgi:putative ABC transport system permease protein